MREAALLASTPQVRKRAARLHDGTTTVAVADTLWATDATDSWTVQDGRRAVFVTVDRASGEAWFEAAARMNRWAAADLLREVTIERFGSVEPAVAAGLALRHDGRQLLPRRALPDRDRPPRHQPLNSVPLRARDQRRRREGDPDPQGAGALDRAFDTLEELRAAVRAFGRQFNAGWLIERHDFRTPTEARDHLIRQATMA